MPDVTSLYSTVKNPTAGAITYGYLGPHGKRLLAAATYTFNGDVGDMINHGHGHRGRRRKSFEKDLLASRIELLATPAPVFRNTTNQIIKVLTVSGTAPGTIGVADPSWGAYTG